jgi:hypothetical protein
MGDKLFTQLSFEAWPTLSGEASVVSLHLKDYLRRHYPENLAAADRRFLSFVRARDDRHISLVSRKRISRCWA